MIRRARLFVFSVAKVLGIFAFCRLVTRRDLRILCYHGVALRDGHKFRPTLFIREETFVKRLERLKRSGYPVLPLNEALKGLKSGTLPRNAVVITIDDGWYGTYASMIPLLRSYGFPATLYVSTYYVINQVQVFNVALAYVLWKATKSDIDLCQISGDLAGRYDISNPEEQDKVFDVLNAYGCGLVDAAARQVFFRKLCALLNVDWEDIENNRLATFMTEDEVKDAVRQGIDVQLHTHRHRFSNMTFTTAKREIEENHNILEPLVGRAMEHFCFPSGYYGNNELKYLKDLGIKSAVTTRPGFNRKDTNILELKRFLDSDTLSELEFEAELSGFTELMRQVRYWTTGKAPA